MSIHQYCTGYTGKKEHTGKSLSNSPVLRISSKNDLFETPLRGVFKKTRAGRARRTKRTIPMPAGALFRPSFRFGNLFHERPVCGHNKRRTSVRNIFFFGRRSPFPGAENRFRRKPRRSRFERSAGTRARVVRETGALRRISGGEMQGIEAPMQNSYERRAAQSNAGPLAERPDSMRLFRAGGRTGPCRRYR
jgi:hypothetical protein